MTDYPGAVARRPLWIALTWIAVYIAMAAGLPYALELVGAPDDSSTLSFAISHAGLPLVIAAGLVFVHRSRWPVWTVPAASFVERPRRRWMLLVPLALFVQGILMLFDVPWSERAAVFVIVLALGTFLIGLGEEMFFRGILRTSLDSRHGETVTLLVTAALFGLAHSFGSLVHGLPIGFIALQVAATAMDGVLFFAALKATGTLWVPIALHALGDFARYASSGETDAAAGHDPNASAVWLQVALMALAVVVIISAIRADVRARRARRA